MIDVTGISSRLGPGLAAELAATAFPPMHRVRQTMPRPRIDDIRAVVAEQFARPEIRSRLVPGQRVCVAVGSRGIAQLREIMVAVVRELRSAGTEPYLIPAMGSHGGATAEGQTRLLASLGVTAESVGAPIVSSMEVTTIGQIAGDTPLYYATDAAAADAVVVVNRIKPHTGFRGPVESGLMKMLAVGMGKQKGASSMHALGMHRFARLIPSAARVVLATQPIACGVAVVENGYEEPARIEAITPEEMERREAELLTEARSLLPSLPFDRIDVLVVREMGKEISGSGLDPNVTGRYARGAGFGSKPQVQIIAVTDLTSATRGNAVGIGLADLTTGRVLEKIDLAATYANCLTASHLGSAMLPMALENDRACIAAALRTASPAPGAASLAIIRNTRDLAEFWVSPSLAAEARAKPGVEVDAASVPIEFGADGNLLPPFVWCDDIRTDSAESDRTCTQNQIGSESNS